MTQINPKSTMTTSKTLDSNFSASSLSADQSKKRSSGISSIFKWFRGRDRTSKNYIDRENSQHSGSNSSLASAASSFAYVPMTRSQSADIQEKMVSPKRKSFSFRYKRFSKEASLSRLQADLPKNKASERLSAASGASIDSSARDSSLNAGSLRKKRRAPQPPSQTSTLSYDKNCSSLPGNDGNNQSHSYGIPLQKSKSEGIIFRKTKRRAPAPPTQNESMKRNSIGGVCSVSQERQREQHFPSMTPKEPILSNTLKSNSSTQSVSSSSTLQSKHDNGSNVNVPITQEQNQTSPSGSHVTEENKLVPRPWYKRKAKDKSGSSKNTTKTNTIYESWMPDIPFSRKKSKCLDDSQNDSGIETKDHTLEKDKIYGQTPMQGYSEGHSTEATSQRPEHVSSEIRIDERKFGKFNRPFILSQEDFVPEKINKYGTIEENQTNKSNDDSGQRFADYNTAHHSQHTTSNFLNQNYSVDESVYDNVQDLIQSPDLANYEAPHSFDAGRHTDKITPIQKAAFNAELFYQLAKDAGSLTRGASSSNVNSGRLEMEDRSDLEVEETASDSRRQSKYFGLRMNNAFTPDVSTILEATESMTSSAATPLECLDPDYEDFAASFVHGPGRCTSYDGQNTEIHQDAVSVLDIMRELAEVREEIAIINQEEEEEAAQRLESRAEKIKAEIRLFREKDNFQFWRNTVTEANNSTNMPIDLTDLTDAPERKLKWVCHVCTLINLPWRLQCEACMVRRPENAQRVEEDGISVASDHVTSSGHSAQTVIHRDGSNPGTFDINSSDFRSVPAGQLAQEDTGLHSQATANHHDKPSVETEKNILPSSIKTEDVNDKSNRDINWEKELKKYFNPSKGKTKSTQKTRYAEKIDACGINNTDGNFNAATGISNGGAGIRNGTRPKMRDQLATNSPNAKCPSANSKNETVPTSLGSESITETPDLQSVRQQRLARFGGETVSTSEAGNQQCHHQNDQNNENTRSNTGNEANINSIRNNISTCNNDREDVPQNKDAKYESLMMGNKPIAWNPEEKNHYGKIYRKAQVLKPSGAVQSAVSVFNQMEQISQASKGKPKVIRRRSFGNIIGKAQIFEKKNSEPNSPRSQRKAEMPRDRDINHAIAKYDDMAAQAELENIEKQRKRREAIQRSSSHAPVRLPRGSSQHGGRENNSMTQKLEFKDGVIKGGILYTEQRSRTMSVGSGTFELIEAKDFENIEAQIEAKDFESIEAQHNDSTSVDNSIPKEASESNIVQSSIAYSPETTIRPTSGLNNPQDVEHPHTTNIMESQEASDNIVRSPDTRETTDVDRLSQQLTEVDGIASFKAVLEVEERNLGQTNTLNINRLLRRLESAITKGNHESASRLAHELAELKISCSVTRKDKNGRNKKSQRPLDLPNLKNAASSYSSHSQANGSDFPSPGETVASVSDCFYDAYEVVSNYAENHFRPTTDPSGQDKGGDGKPSPMWLPPKIPAFEGGGGAALTRRDVKADPARRQVKSDDMTHTAALPPPAPPTYPTFNLKMYVEDKSSHQGPIDVTVNATMTVGQLREKVYQEFGFPPEVQRWILGKRLANDDNHRLEQMHVTGDGCPVFLYLVAPPTPPHTRHQLPTSSSQTRLHSLYSHPYQLARSASEDNYYYDTRGEAYETWEAGGQYEDIYVDTDEDLTEKTYQHTYVNEVDRQDKTSQPGVSQVAAMQPIPTAQALQGRGAAMPPIPTAQALQPHGERSQASRLENNTQAMQEEFQEPIVIEKVGDNHDIVPPPTVKPVLGLYNDSKQSGTHNQMLDNSKQTQNHILEDKQKQTQNHILEDKQKQKQNHTLEDKQKQTQNLNNKQTHNQIVDNNKQTQNQIVDNNTQTQNQNLDNKKQTQNQNVDNIKETQDQKLDNKQTRIQPLDDNQTHTQALDNNKQTNTQALDDNNKQTHKQMLENNKQTLNSNKQTSHEKSHNPVLAQDTLNTAVLKLVEKDSMHNAVRTRNANIMTQQSPENSASVQQPVDVPGAVANVRPIQEPPSDSPQDTIDPKPKQNKNGKKKVKPKAEKVSKDVKEGAGGKDTRLGEKLSKDVQEGAAGKDTRPEESARGKDMGPGEKVPQDVQESASGKDTRPDTTPNGWVCPSCTLLNAPHRPGCEVCATERPEASQPLRTTAQQTAVLDEALSAMERQGVVANHEAFECRVCFCDMAAGEGVLLRDCLHSFCRECLGNAVKYSDTAAVKCPYRDNQYSCDATLQDREVRALVSPEDYERHLAKSVKQAEGAMENVFHCKTPDCIGFCQYEDNVNVFPCNVCKKVNCLTCQAQHDGITCQNYQDNIKNQLDENALKTKKFFDDMIRRGDGLPCPKCSVMLVRKWGCDWMRCPMCRTEICWVTRGPRWGPGGPGDITGGCKCGTVRGQKCHPKCTYCH